MTERIELPADWRDQFRLIKNGAVNSEAVAKTIALVASWRPASSPEGGDSTALPPFVLLPAFGDPDVTYQWSEDGEPAPGTESVGWSMTSGCRVNFGQHDDGGYLFHLSLFGDVLKRGVEQRTVTAEQVRSFAHQLLALLPAEAGDIEALAAPKVPDLNPCSHDPFAVFCDCNPPVFDRKAALAEHLGYCEASVQASSDPEGGEGCPELRQVGSVYCKGHDLRPASSVRDTAVSPEMLAEIRAVSKWNAERQFASSARDTATPEPIFEIGTPVYYGSWTEPRFVDARHWDGRTWMYHATAPGRCGLHAAEVLLAVMPWPGRNTSPASSVRDTADTTGTESIEESQ